jgi:hypothetical protein
MSKGSKKQTTQTLASNGDYHSMLDSNNKLADEWLLKLFPELYEFKRISTQFDVPFDDVVDFIYNVRAVKRHGWGNVQIVIEDSQVTRIDANIRTLKRRIQSQTLPKQDRS